jgi:transcriptional regulator with XRE-family HTH domain
MVAAQAPLTAAPGDRQATVSKAMLRAADLLGMSAKELSAVIGLSEATLSRLKKGQSLSSVSGKAYELALLFVRLYRSLDAIAGGDDAVSRRWLRAENTALGGTPLSRIRTIDGLAHVLAYLDARRAPL